MAGNRFSEALRVYRVREMELTVEAGQVVCPGRGVIDVERCFVCGAYRGLHDGRTERLLCARGPIEAPIGPVIGIPR